MTEPGCEASPLAPEPSPLKTPHPEESMWLGPSVLFHPNLLHLSPQWLPESARYDVLSGNQEKAIATLKRIATENGAPMPLGKLIISRQVGAWPTVCGVCVCLCPHGEGGRGWRALSKEVANPKTSKKSRSRLILQKPIFLN